MAFAIACKNPFCGATFVSPVDFVGVTIIGAQQNIAVSCPRCGFTFDATEGGDGTWSSASGKLVQLARFVRDASPEELAHVRAEAERITHERRTEEALALAERLGWRPPSTVRDRLEAANLAFDVLEKLVRIIGILLVAGVWTAGQVDDLFQQWFG